MPAAFSRRILAWTLAASVAMGLAACAPERAVEPSTTPSASAPASLPAPVEKVKSFFDKNRYSIDDPLSIWAVNDKIRPFDPLDYIPPDLVTPDVHYISSPLMRKEAAAAIKQLFAASAAEGAGELQIQNAYRSFAVQTSIHNRLVAQLGKEKAQAQSARPGYSEHQAGLSADVVGRPAVCAIQQCFGKTPQGVWLAKNAWRFGFVIRYPEGKQAVTGYIYEPWHIRYVGVYLSTELHNTGIQTLEEFFDLPPAPDYVD
ncbi:D-alanyl-D-alanine carboxypeptidase [Cryobacterium mesophilum]|uniref:D-alanyl-D-alanine carboxypeptidase family protein n=1 Tax=Terrimesophilobacter mesophilus TaxID=433647 RepID=A0A4R8VCB4_9MICO|nr:M15 family metallopeptidase [Terrimesophilobacter mesophilus]MBB5632993.1 D-alanyl-D-alanine carboxypeptidase [Terrimesophilobacter mesophilus]TFB79760.1 D-alanyl-D-alanine carboxypeptidase family protein [Terrimesophilobacter mesophilus]